MLIYLLFCFLFFLLQGFFTAAEFSYTSSRHLFLRHRKEKGDRRAEKVYSLIIKPQRFLATTLIGTNISVILSSIFLTLFFIESYKEVSNFWITFLYTPFVVIFAELLPKNIGRVLKEKFSCGTVEIIYFFEKVFSPLILCVDKINNFLFKLFPSSRKNLSPFVSKEEIKALLEEAAEKGAIDLGEKKAIEEAFSFKYGKVGDVCVKMKKVSCLDDNLSRDDVLKIAATCGFTRYPVFSHKKARSKISGYINIFDIFYNPQRKWQENIRPLTCVGVNQKLSEVFKVLKEKRETLALVLKGNKPYGIVTLEDIFRQIITSIVKE